MKIFVGADHRGFALKNEIVRRLRQDGYEVMDNGTHDASKSCDYPKVAVKVARAVAETKNSRGILVCMTGIGHVITANKVPGAYAALCYNRKAAELSRQHNDSNILVLGARFVKRKELMAIVKVWLKTKFEGGRHLRRVRQMKRIERSYAKS